METWEDCWCRHLPSRSLLWSYLIIFFILLACLFSFICNGQQYDKENNDKSKTGEINSFHFIFWEISSLRLAFFSLISFHFINNCLQTIKWKLRKLINEREEYDLPIPFQKRKKRRWLMAELKLTSSMGHHVSSLFKKGILWPFPRSFKSSLRLTEASAGQP